MRTIAPRFDETDRWVFAVPPLARAADGGLDRAANQRMIRHIESGGLTMMMYGGNANFYHLAGRDYAEALEMLAELAGKDSWMIPSAGPDFGKLMEAAPVLRDLRFPSAMMLPAAPTTPSGVARGARLFAERLKQPVILYVKAPGYVDPGDAKRLIADGVVLFIKYGIITPEPASDPYLARLVEAVGPGRIVSGSGEIVALPHLRKHNLFGFTTGCGCIAPASSLALLRAIRQGDWQSAERLEAAFAPLERERERLGPIPSLHGVMGKCGIAEMGPLQPLLSALPDAALADAARAARELLAFERQSAGAS
jgi:dihydrodipicolinate synthase/N-acetylneuraminate lyase